VFPLIFNICLRDPGCSDLHMSIWWTSFSYFWSIGLACQAPSNMGSMQQVRGMPVDVRLGSFSLGCCSCRRHLPHPHARLEGRPTFVSVVRAPPGQRVHARGAGLSCRGVLSHPRRCD